MLRSLNEADLKLLESHLNDDGATSAVVDQDDNIKNGSFDATAATDVEKVDTDTGA